MVPTWSTWSFIFRLCGFLLLLVLLLVSCVSPLRVCAFPCQSVLYEVCSSLCVVTGKKATASRVQLMARGGTEWEAGDRRGRNRLARNKRHRRRFQFTFFQVLLDCTSFSSRDIFRDVHL